MKKMFASPSSVLFAIGDTLNGNRYTPAALNFTSGTFNSASVEMQLTAEKHPANKSVNDFINRYWTVMPAGITGFSCDVSFNYHGSDVNGTEGNMYLGRWDGTVWANVLNKADTVNRRLFGTVTAFSQFTGGESGGLTFVDVPSIMPRVFSLSQNYPNPFNPTTMISYQIPSHSSVSLRIYDILGKEVATVVNERQEPGTYSVTIDAARYGMSSGLYFYTIDARGASERFVRVLKMMLVK
jgi:hypothetical protein